MQQQQNRYSSQMYTELSPGYITGQVTKQILTNLKTKIIPNVFSDHSGMKLYNNSRRKTQKYKYMWKLTSSEQPLVKEEMKREIRKKLKKNKNQNTTYQK